MLVLAEMNYGLSNKNVGLCSTATQQYLSDLQGKELQVAVAADAKIFCDLENAE